ncbi:MAG: tol-pal system protein YbgF [Ectothiorhodospiraceae bacterium]|nr:tol-pal system protein YbgF [Ectothiorhodospiraceae bacterium]
MTYIAKCLNLKSVSMALVILAAPSFVSTAVARQPAPIIEGTSEPSSTSQVSATEKRLARLERLLENQSLLELMTRMDTLQNEVRQLIGQMEEQTYGIEQLKKRQRDLYLDIDRRLRSAEEMRISTPPASMSGGSVFSGAAPAMSGGQVGTQVGTTGQPGNAQATKASSITGSQMERADYERAFNLLKEGRYDLAVAAFKTFVQTHPGGHFSDNAQYWLGEANYVQRNFTVALAEFEKVIKNHPGSSKRADALLKMGYTYEELGQNGKARLSLNNVVLNFPNSTAAKLAKRRLQELKRR